jgi:tetratricopeptide (TPR) repeat protein
MHVFISYAIDDAEDLARHLYKSLVKNKEITVFYDKESLNYGDEWKNKIFEQIEKSDLFIAILTIKALKSDMVNEEINHAKLKNIKIIPCKYQDLSWSEINWDLDKNHGFEFKVKEELIRELGKNFDNNIIKSSSLIEKDKGSPSQYKSDKSSRTLQKAYRLSKLTKYKESNEIMENETDEEKTLILKSWNYQGLRKYDMALKMAEEAIKLNDESELGWLYKSNCLGITGEINEALNAAEKAIESNPDSSDAWYNKGLCLLNLEKYEEAIKSFDQVIKLNKNADDAWVNLGFALSKLKKYRSSSKMFEKALTINPIASDTWSNLANILYILKEYDDAINKLIVSLELNINNHNAWHISGLIFEQIGLADEAEKCFGIVRTLNKNFPLIRIMQLENISEENKKYLHEKSIDLVELIDLKKNG